MKAIRSKLHALAMGLGLVACPAVAAPSVQGTPSVLVTPKELPPSIDDLRAPHSVANLVYERKLDDGDGYSAYLVSYLSAGLKVYAMVAVPRTPRPAAGFPILVADHGFAPNPLKYGVTAQGVDSRPGDYYRPIPELYAKQGFLVVMPDYRGHNISQGREYTGGFLASSYYTEDVLTLIGALPDLKDADSHNIFMWGHSMGGEVTLRALLATSAIKGASLWSSVGGSIWDQAYFYSRYEDRLLRDGSDTPKPPFDTLREDIRELGERYDWTAREPLRYLSYLTTPLIIHQAIGDTEANYNWSERLAGDLYLGGHRYLFYTYAGTDHFLKPPQREQAVNRDITFFRSLMAETPHNPSDQ